MNGRYPTHADLKAISVMFFYRCPFCTYEDHLIMTTIDLAVRCLACGRELFLSLNPKVEVF